MYKRCQVVVRCGLDNRYMLRGGAKGENGRRRRKDGKSQSSNNINKKQMQRKETMCDGKRGTCNWKKGQRVTGLPPKH